MNLSLKLVVILAALACFGLAAVWSPPRGNLVAAGLFLWLEVDGFA